MGEHQRSQTKNCWNTIFKLSYDVLHTLAEAFILFDKTKCANHHCLFTYLCTKHPGLDFDRDFLERFRTKRNGIQYYSETIAKADFKENEVQIVLYVKTLRDALDERLRKGVGD